MKFSEFNVSINSITQRKIKMTLPAAQFFNNKRRSIIDFTRYESKLYYCKFIIVCKSENFLNVVIYKECLREIFVKPVATNTNSHFTL